MRMNEYLKAMQALPKLRMNADRMLAAAPAPEAEQWWDGYRQALHDMAVELSGWHLGRSTWLAAERDQFHVDGSRTAVTTCRIASITSSG